jgi:2-amino-4-hydroxy-6-hydroxymethyldihydropteridine diphosphokinase
MSTQNSQHLAFVALGTNRGQLDQNLTRATDLLAKTDGCTITARSSFESYPAEGVRPDAPDYLNAVVALTTDLNPHALQAVLQRIETEMGRPNPDLRQLHEDRIIDLDLLLYDQMVLVSPSLTLPHPRMHRRRFVLEPLCQIAPDVLHPALGVTASRLLARLTAEDSP